MSLSKVGIKIVYIRFIQVITNDRTWIVGHPVSKYFATYFGEFSRIHK